MDNKRQDPERIDFSALDLGRSPARFERMVQSVLSGAMHVEPEVHPMVLSFVHWGRSALMVAAAVAVVAWLPKWMSTPQEPVASQTDPVELMSAWASTGQLPEGVDVADVLGDLHERR